MKRILQWLWTACVYSSLAACQTVDNPWQAGADQTRDADHVNVSGYTEVPRVLDVVLITEATNIPFFYSAECLDRSSPKLFATRHRFRTKPGKVSFAIPALPNSNASSRCSPKLKEIRIEDLGQTGKDRRVIAHIPDPMGGTILLNFPNRQKTR